MENFKFYVDRKCTTWERESFSIEAESKEEAIKQVIKTLKDNDYFPNADVETLYDTTEYMETEENGGYPTIELYEEDENDMIWNNAEE